MRELRGRARLALESLSALGVGSKARWQELDRHGALEGTLPRKVDGAHPAAAQQTNNLVLRTERVLQGSLLDIAGRHANTDR